MGYKLVMIRHGESVWNKENLFTGWTDVDLSENGRNEAKLGGKVLKDNGYSFDICYTSYLKRAIHTANYVLEQLDEEWIPVIKTWKLNERHYGALQGLNKSETAEKYGEDQVKIWRRSFDVRPPALDETDERNPALQPMFKNVDKNELPLCESLKDTIARVIPYYEETIKKDMAAGKNVLIAAHGNSLRALVIKNATTGGLYTQVGEFYGFPIKVVSERILKEGLEFTDNRFVVEGNYKAFERAAASLLAVVADGETVHLVLDGGNEHLLLL